MINIRHKLNQRKYGGNQNGCGFSSADSKGYMLNHDNAAAASSMPSLSSSAPQMKGGSCMACGSTPPLNGGGQRRRKGGAPIELTAFISALALLGARLIADKNSGFMNPFASNMEQEQERESQQVGGKKNAAYRVRRPVARPAQRVARRSRSPPARRVR